MNRIICFIASLSSGGAEHQMTILADKLCESGYDVTIATFVDVPDHYSLDKRIQRIRLANGKNSFMKFLSIFSFFYNIKTDCVISFAQRNNTFSLIPLLFRKKIKIIVGERNNTYQKPTIFEIVNFNFLYHKADYIVPNSYTQSKYIIKKKPIFKDKVRTIINYAELDKYLFKPLPNNDVRRISIFCRYDKQKNCERFASAVRKLKNKAKVPFEIEWYGDKSFKGLGVNKDYEDFNRLVEEYNIQDVLHLNDKVTNVPLLMAESDAICLPSLYEGFSNTLAEAICCGRPVLASDVSDNCVMVENGKNGFLFNPLDEDDIVDAFMRFLIISEYELKKMGRYSREKAEKLFSNDNFVCSYINLIEN